MAPGPVFILNNLECYSWVDPKMTFQPRFAPKARWRQVVSEESQQMAPLEASGVAPPPVAGAVVRGSALPTASVMTQPGCTMRMRACPRLPSGSARAMKGTKTVLPVGWLEKVSQPLVWMVHIQTTLKTGNLTFLNG